MIFRTSSPVITACTPGTARAASTSMPVIVACATRLRTTRASSMPGTLMLWT
jgi:hypothetical protein